MIAGRLRWKKRGVAIPRKRAHAAFDFPAGSLLLTEASTKKRASLHFVRGEAALAELDPGGIEVFESDADAFRRALECERHTLKRSLTDPNLFSGIGNAYSDEILHRARLSPLKMSDRLTDEEFETLRAATLDVLSEWTARLRAEVGAGFPDKVTAFRPEMAVHGKFREPCPVCQNSGPAHRARGKRSQLLPDLSDGRQGPRGPGALQAAREGLAAHAGRTREAPTAQIASTADQSLAIMMPANFRRKRFWRSISSGLSGSTSKRAW